MTKTAPTFKDLRNKGKKLLSMQRLTPAHVRQFNLELEQYKKANNWERDISLKLNFELWNKL